MLLSVLPLILAALIIATGLGLTWRRARETGDAWAIACMACGAPATGLAPTSFACPGCGNDVRSAGLAPRLLRFKRAGLHPLLRVAMFSAVFATVASIVILGPLFQREGGQLSRYTLTLATPADEPGLRSAEMVVDAIRDGERSSGFGSLTLVTDTGLATMDVSLPDLTATIVGDAGNVGTPQRLSPNVYDALARQGGLDPTGRRVADQLGAIRAEFGSLLESGVTGRESTRGHSGHGLFVSVSGSGGGSGTAGMPAVRPARWGFAVAAGGWLAGVAYLLRRDRTARGMGAAAEGAKGGGVA